MDAGTIALLVESFIKPILVSTFLSCCAAGCVMALIASYLQRFGSSDRLAFRLLVAGLTLLLLADTGNDCAWLYSVAVRGQEDLSSLLELPAYFSIYSAVTGMTVLLAQVFFTWRIWIISGKSSYLLPGFLLATELGAYATSLYILYAATKIELFSEFGQIKGAPWAWLALGLCVDLVITIATVYYLLVKPRKNGAMAKDAVVHSPLTRVVLVTARTNSLSLLVQLLTLWLIIWKTDTFHYAIPGFLEVKVYCASVLITLNSRRATTTAAAEFSDTPGTSRFSRSPKGGAGGRSTLSRAGPLESVQVRIEEETHVERDDSSLGGLAAGGTLPGTRPFAVKFEDVRGDGVGWTAGEKGDVELGRLEGWQLSEKY